MTETLTVQRLAAAAAGQFETRVRPDGSRYDCVREDAPDREWLTELCLWAHGDMGPDDVRYALILEILEVLADHEDPDQAFPEADEHVHHLAAWLGSRPDRAVYVDLAVRDYGHSHRGVVGDLMMGQLMEKEEVLELVVAALEARSRELKSLAGSRT